MKLKPIKIRKSWPTGFNPVERVKQSKKTYNRQLSKKQLRKILREEDF